MIRIVKMTFDPDCVSEFEALFEKNKSKIRAFEGCTHLQLLRDINQTNIFFTYSFWEHPKYLEEYRNSALFNEVWTNTKKLFSAKPGAGGLKKKLILE